MIPYADCLSFFETEEARSGPACPGNLPSDLRQAGILGFPVPEVFAIFEDHDLVVMAPPSADERGALWEFDWVPLLPLSGDALLGCWCRSVAGRGFEQAACVGVEPAMGLLLEMPRKASDESLLEVRGIATDAEICPFLLEPGWSQIGQSVEFDGHRASLMCLCVLASAHADISLNERVPDALGPGWLQGVAGVVNAGNPLTPYSHHLREIASVYRDIRAIISRYSP